MKQLFLAGILAFVLTACGKDKFKTEPQVEIKSIAPDVVLNDGFFTFKAIIRDDEGDLQDTVYLVEKYFALNGTVPVRVDTNRISLKNIGFPTNQEIDFQVTYSYGEQRDIYQNINLQNQDRHFLIGMIVKDKAGHKSEYLESDRIVLKKL